MTSSIKRNTLISLGLVMIITMMIAASLPQLELKPGMPLPKLEDGQVVAAPVEKQEFVAISINKFIVMFFSLVLAGLMLYIMYKLFKGADWKMLISSIPSTLFVSLLVMTLIFLIVLLPRSTDSVPTDLPLPTPAPSVRAPLGPVPPLLIWFVGFGLLIIAILIGFWIFLSSSKQTTTLDIVRLEAEKAWQALKNGLDLKVVIIQCYRQMSLVLQKEQGIERKDFMTTGEFEGLLEAAGVPHDPVHQLTRLFEAVRYGNWQPNPVDHQKAIQSLEAIVLFSREAKRTD
jgi:hypothetical protein